MHALSVNASEYQQTIQFGVVSYKKISSHGSTITSWSLKSITATKLSWVG
jgi:hypothetical protein